MKLKKLFMILIVSMLAVSLVGCGKDKGGKDNGGSNNNNNNSGQNNNNNNDNNNNNNGPELWYPATIEELNQKYSGFEIQYRKGDQLVFVGAKDDVYWVLYTNSDMSVAYASSIVSEKSDDKWLNYFYNESTKQFETYSGPSANNTTAITANAYYIGFLQSGLEEYTPTQTTLDSINCRKYALGFGEYGVWVHSQDRYTMQVTYASEPDNSIMFVHVTKGANVEIPKYR